jgi:hypothetical protein
MPLEPGDLERLTKALTDYVAARLAPNVALIAADIDRQAADGDDSTKSRTISVGITLDVCRWSGGGGYTATADIAWCRKHQTKDDGAPLEVDLKQLDLPLPATAPPTCTLRVIHPDGSTSPEIDLAAAEAAVRKHRRARA